MEIMGFYADNRLRGLAPSPDTFKLCQSSAQSLRGESRDLF